MGRARRRRTCSSPTRRGRLPRRAGRRPRRSVAERRRGCAPRWTTCSPGARSPTRRPSRSAARSSGSRAPVLGRAARRTRRRWRSCARRWARTSRSPCARSMTEEQAVARALPGLADDPRRRRGPVPDRRAAVAELPHLPARRRPLLPHARSGAAAARPGRRAGGPPPRARRRKRTAGSSATTRAPIAAGSEYRSPVAPPSSVATDAPSSSCHESMSASPTVRASARIGARRAARRARARGTRGRVELERVAGVANDGHRVEPDLRLVVVDRPAVVGQQLRVLATVLDRRDRGLVVDVPAERAEERRVGGSIPNSTACARGPPAGRRAGRRALRRCSGAWGPRPYLLVGVPSNLCRPGLRSWGGKRGRPAAAGAAGLRSRRRASSVVVRNDRASASQAIPPADRGRGHVAERVGQPAAVAGRAGLMERPERVGHDRRPGRAGVAQRGQLATGQLPRLAADQRRQLARTALGRRRTILGGTRRRHRRADRRRSLALRLETASLLGHRLARRDA